MLPYLEHSIQAKRDLSSLSRLLQQSILPCVLHPTLQQDVRLELI